MVLKTELVPQLLILSLPSGTPCPLQQLYRMLELKTLLLMSPLSLSQEPTVRLLQISMETSTLFALNSLIPHRLFSFPLYFRFLFLCTLFFNFILYSLFHVLPLIITHFCIAPTPTRRYVLVLILVKLAVTRPSVALPSAPTMLTKKLAQPFVQMPI